MISSDITGPLFRPVLFIGRFVNGMGIGGMMLIVPVSVCFNVNVPIANWLMICYICRSFEVH